MPFGFSTLRCLCLLPLLTLTGCRSPMAFDVPGFGTPTASAPSLPPSQVQKIGHRIWQNECAGTVSGLTSWNSGEEFASLGIGHFIWYPANYRGPFEESFPELVAFFVRSGVPVPAWVQQTRYCPWPNRAAFLRDSKSPHQQELRAWLSRTVPEQTEFIIDRLHRSAARFTGTARANYAVLSRSPEGMFAMIDYVNFKGDGMNPTERYRGQGWGLAQVLTIMRAPTTACFAEAAKQLLTQRVHNAPPARGEARWLPGWKQRCDSYARRF